MRGKIRLGGGGGVVTWGLVGRENRNNNLNSKTMFSDDPRVFELMEI